MGFVIRKEEDQTWLQKGEEIAEQNHAVLEFYELYEEYQQEGYGEKNSVLFSLYDLHLIDKIEDDSDEDTEDL